MSFDLGDMIYISKIFSLTKKMAHMAGKNIIFHHSINNENKSDNLQQQKLPNHYGFLSIFLKSFKLILIVVRIHS